MDWPVFSLLSASAALKALVGTTPPRIFEDSVPQELAGQRPYIVWFTVGGTPENYVSELPTMDGGRIQLDVYSTSKAECKAIAKLVRDLIEPEAYMISVPRSFYEADTKLYRYLLEFQFFTART
jgi:hypothetical protein